MWRVETLPSKGRFFINYNLFLFVFKINNLLLFFYGNSIDYDVCFVLHVQNRIGPFGMLKGVVGKGKSTVNGLQSLCVKRGAFGMREKPDLLKD